MLVPERRFAQIPTFRSVAGANTRTKEERAAAEAEETSPVGPRLAEVAISKLPAPCFLSEHG